KFLICSFRCGIKIKSTGQMGPETKPAKRDPLLRVFCVSGGKDRNKTMMRQRSDGMEWRGQRRQRDAIGAWKSHYGGCAFGP
ncbi:hypothetical protein, partial [Thalassospira lucentensis]|uniref:hypothetical protein n=1 Tax=Thalassospira lucentensis TaxID=168935 RepID=UPI001E350994